MIIRAMIEADLPGVAAIHAECFPRHLDTDTWIECNFRAFPRMLCFVADDGESLLGYIQWCQRAGFRKQAVLELEHLAVSAAFRGCGIGRSLIRASLVEVRRHLKAREAELKHIVVTTRADNAAQRLYRSELDAEVEFTIRDLYSADEVYMLSRNYGEKLRDEG